jgi:hypothetical protein
MVRLFTAFLLIPKLNAKKRLKDNWYSTIKVELNFKNWSKVTAPKIFRMT